MPVHRSVWQNALSACRRPPSAGRRGEVPEPVQDAQDAEGKSSAAAPGAVVQTEQWRTTGQQRHLEAMLVPEGRLREDVPPPAPPALQRAPVDGNGDTKPRQTQAAPIQQHPDQNKQRCDIKPATEEANRVRKGPAPTLEATATQAGPTGVLAQFRGQTPGGTRIIGAVQTTDPAVRTRLACPPRSKILVDPGQQMPDMTDGDGANRTGDKTQDSVGH